ncbi:MAG: hypothetical protein ACLVFC_09680 [Subdoligranulum sp.]
MSNYLPFFGSSYFRAIPHNSRLTAQAPLRRLRHGICVAKMLDKTSSIICAFGLASAAPRSPYRHLELCGVALAKGLPHCPPFNFSLLIPNFFKSEVLCFVSIPFSRSFGAHEVYYAVGADALHAAGKPE